MDFHPITDYNLMRGDDVELWRNVSEAIGAEAMAKLTAFYETFAALDGVKEYLARRKKVWGLPGSRAQPA